METICDFKIQSNNDTLKLLFIFLFIFFFGAVYIGLAYVSFSIYIHIDNMQTLSISTYIRPCGIANFVRRSSSHTDTQFIYNVQHTVSHVIAAVYSTPSNVHIPSFFSHFFFLAVEKCLLHLQWMDKSYFNWHMKSSFSTWRNARCVTIKKNRWPSPKNSLKRSFYLSEQNRDLFHYFAWISNCDEKRDDDDDDESEIRRLGKRVKKKGKKTPKEKCYVKRWIELSRSPHTTTVDCVSMAGRIIPNSCIHDELRRRRKRRRK